ncbi:MAG TPA: HlyD family efflux transporter periplasmic adaptor subunit [Gemmatimonadales bacterium]|nr:HlyD family efflux transporter periplasmic adaptor subunit [Gemmatimonadales bacterium]
MSRPLPRALASALALATAVLVGVWLVTMYHRHEARLEAQAGLQEPVVAPSRVRESGGEATVVLDTADERRLGLRVAPVRAAVAAPEVRLTGELVPEPDRTAAVRAPLAGRLSVPDGAHWPGFGDRVSAGALVAQVSDAKPLAAPRGGVVTHVGAQPDEMVQPGQVLLEITDYTQPLARIAWPADAPRPPASLALVAPGRTGGRVTARLVGASPEADALTRLPAFLYRAERSWSGARPGAAVFALLPRGGSARRGVLVPDRALVQWEGLVWAYVEREPGRFSRVRVPTDRPVAGGMLATTLEPGTPVVIEGAEQLLSEEFRARVTVGDEANE